MFSSIRPYLTIRSWLSERAILFRHSTVVYLNWLSLSFLLIGKTLGYHNWKILSYQLLFYSVLLSVMSTFSSLTISGEKLSESDPYNSSFVPFLLASGFYVAPYFIGAFSTFWHPNGACWGFYLALSGALIAVHIYDYSVRQCVPFSTMYSYVSITEEDTTHFQTIIKTSMIVTAFFTTSALFRFFANVRSVSPFDIAAFLCIISGYLSTFSAVFDRNKKSIHAASAGSVFVDDIV